MGLFFPCAAAEIGWTGPACKRRFQARLPITLRSFG
jgi:hypothetical protein